MKLKKLFNDLKRCKPYKKDVYVKPTIKFDIDTRNYYFSFFPTIMYQPWVYRLPDFVGVIDIWWMNCHILIGTSVNKEG